MASDQLANAMDSQDEMTVMRVPEDRRCEIAKAINWRRRSSLNRRDRPHPSRESAHWLTTT